VLVLKDVYSAFAWCYFLKRKSDAAAKLKEWALQQKNTMGKMPSYFHTDKGGEFLSAELKSFWSREGVIVSTTLAYTPQHNGVLERFNRELAEGTRTALLAAGAPKLLWAEAMSWYTYVSNMFHTPGQRQQTPHQLYTGSEAKPDISSLVPWGCDAIVRVTPALELDKFDARGVPAIYIGHESHGHRLMDPVSMQIKLSRHVKFAPNSFSQMQKLKTELAGTELEEEQTDESHFADLALRGELRLTQSREGEHVGEAVWRSHEAIERRRSGWKRQRRR